MERLIIFRQDISASGLYNIAQREFSKIEDPRQVRKTSVSLKDALLSALAVFLFKWPSLLSFEIDIQHDEVIAGNLRRLFHIDRIPSDTTLREIIDEIPPEALHEVFTRVFAALQRGKDLKAYVFMDGHYLVALDGTGVFSSGSINCPSCCVKNHRNGNCMDARLHGRRR